MALDTRRWLPDGRPITTSIGVTQRHSATDTPSSLLGRADHALYAAKRAGRNRVCGYGQPEPPPRDEAPPPRALRA
jgi:GGDEF domain-containing protein